MKVLLLIILAIILLIFLYLYPVTEGFLDPEFEKKYDTFLAFYNPFLANWEKAIMTSMSMQITQAPLTSPSQIGSATGNAPTFPRIQMNQYIEALSKKLNQPLPPLTDPLPEKVDEAMIPKLVKEVPQEPAPYENALKWMNEQLEASHQNLDGALQGKSTEGFADNCQDFKCQDYAQCMSDPDVIDQISDAQENQKANKLKKQQKQITLNVDKFNKNESLQQAITQNKGLVQQSEAIKNQAQSGELLNKMKLPEDPMPPYQIPKGGNRLREMKESDPDKYKEYEKNHSSLFGIKQWMEQINGNL
uniref:Uncharacterized protein n=1 Tax=viral metagenome TaxID=1070528 RepID=A0A6C0KUF4_9ZZZZ